MTRLAVDAGDPPKITVEGSNPSERTKKVWIRG